MNYNIFYL